MNRSEEYTELIDGHIRGTLDAAGESRYEQLLGTDEAFRREAMLTQTIAEGIRDRARKLQAIGRWNTPVPARAASRRRWPLWTAVAASVAILITGGVWFFNRSAGVPQECVAVTPPRQHNTSAFLSTMQSQIDNGVYDRTLEQLTDRFPDNPAVDLASDPEAYEAEWLKLRIYVYTGADDNVRRRLEAFAAIPGPRQAVARRLLLSIR